MDSTSSMLSTPSGSSSLQRFFPLLYSFCMPSPQNSGSSPHQPVAEQHWPRPWLPVHVIWSAGPHMLETRFPSFRHSAGFSAAPSAAASAAVPAAAAAVPAAAQTLCPWL
eukprot:scaffold114785_cov75-Phaeocystis_antarctica.AAC.3